MKGRGIYKSESDYFPIRDSKAVDGLPVNLTLLNFTANLSTINGAAFISNPSTVLTPYLNMKITITAGGKTLTGWIKSAGTGETYDVERFTDPAFDITGDWTKGTGWSVTGGKAVASTSTGDITEALANTVGNLYKLVITSDALTGGTYQGIIEATNIGTAVNKVGATGWYRTVAGAGSATNGIHGATSLSATYTDISLKKVLYPSSTGVRIVSAKGNTTYNWAGNNGIDPNTASFTAVLSLT
jgi:hypothetical protein